MVVSIDITTKGSYNITFAFTFPTTVVLPKKKKRKPGVVLVLWFLCVVVCVLIMKAEREKDLL